MSLILADRAHPARGLLEDTVRAVFLAEYDAHVSNFPERLLASLDGDGQPQAVAGLRFADDQLFSEGYLADKAESVLSSTLGRKVSRQEIVEFSNLAATQAGAAMPLIGAAIRLTLAAGARFGMFTATNRLRALLRRRGLMTIDLGPACPDRLPNANAWGRYYLHDPRVLVITAESLRSDIEAPMTRHVEQRHA